MKNRHEELLSEFRESGQKYEMENMKPDDGHALSVLFFAHASLALVWDGTVVYLDPLMEHADYTAMPKADLLLITHQHYDHLDKDAVAAARKADTVVLTSAEVGKELDGVRVMKPGDELDVKPGISVRATYAYNTTEGHLQFHPKERGDNGYLLTLGETTVYFAGDTEFIPEMKELGRVDIAFLPVNQPYTMTLDQAVEAVKAIKPRIFFPYHTTDTEIGKIAGMLADTPSVSVRIHHMP